MSRQKNESATKSVGKKMGLLKMDSFASSGPGLGDYNPTTGFASADPHTSSKIRIGTYHDPNPTESEH
jgi:hypothetical protein